MIVNSRVPWGERESALRVISDPLLWCAEAPLLLPADNDACVCVCVTGGALSPHNARRPRKASLLIFLCEFLSYFLACEPLSATFTFSLVLMKGKLILLRWFWKETEIANFHQYKVLFVSFFRGEKETLASHLGQHLKEKRYYLPLFPLTHSTLSAQILILYFLSHRWFLFVWPLIVPFPPLNILALCSRETQGSLARLDWLAKQVGR